MRAGAIVVDVAIDQGGCFETSKPTTHTDPTFIVDGVLHYCVANMPGAVARTSTFALTNATYPYVEALANRGILAALSHDPHLRNGLSVHRGNLTSEPVANAQKISFVSVDELIAA
jgi:alanine dehydrogenase